MFTILPLAKFSEAVRFSIKYIANRIFNKDIYAKETSLVNSVPRVAFLLRSINKDAILLVSGPDIDTYYFV